MIIEEKIIMDFINISNLPDKRLEKRGESC